MPEQKSEVALLLTSGDIQFLKLVAEGLTDKQIATRRFTKLASVRTRYRILSEVLLPEEKRSWTRAEFIQHIKTHNLDRRS